MALVGLGCLISRSQELALCNATAAASLTTEAILLDLIHDPYHSSQHSVPASTHWVILNVPRFAFWLCYL
jgi:hypothetical protein